MGARHKSGSLETARSSLVADKLQVQSKRYISDKDKVAKFRGTKNPNVCHKTSLPKPTMHAYNARSFLELLLTIFLRATTPLR